MSDTASLLSAEGLTKKFGGLTAVDSIDWSITGEEIECIVGPNGAGKSTFLKLVMGIHEPTSGRIKYKGEEISDLKSHRRVKRGMSMKFQVPSVYEDLTVAENIRVAAQPYHDDFRAAIDRILSRIQLIEEIEAKAGSLSHGQKQWLEIGMSTMSDPELLLLDEPTAGMSVDETRKTAELLKELREARSFGLVIIDHDMDFIEQISEHVTVFHQGSVFMNGTMEEVRNDEEVQRIYLGR